MLSCKKNTKHRSRKAVIEDILTDEEAVPNYAKA
jgi:hypothetical protein